MNRDNGTAPTPIDSTLTAGAALRLDAVCDRFEADWAAGRRPRIEDRLDALGPADRAFALRELLRLELALRVADGERPDPAEYAARFPGRPEAVEAAFATLPGAAAASTGPGTDPDRTFVPAHPPGGPATAPPGYEILGLLGRGGMGVVYHARQVRLRREVALKMVLAGPHASPEALARLMAEAEAIARLEHPNIVGIYELGDHDGQPYFAMEYQPGGSLSRRLDGNPWPRAEAARLVEAVARGVAEAHRAGLVHRDLKPANILLGRDGAPRVADFGLVKSLGADSGLTGTDCVVGTPSYMAPEQARGGGRNAGPAADLFSIGTVLYELLTGRTPFKGASVVETLDLVRNADPVPPRRLVPGLPRDAETVCLKCLEKDPARRYASADDLADDLGRLARGEPVRARPVSAAEHAWRWCRRRPGVAALVTALVLSVVVGLATVTALWLRAERLRGLAENRRALAESSYSRAGAAVRDVMDRLIDDDLLDRPGLEPLRRDLLGRGRDAFNGLIAGYRAYEAEAGRPPEVDYNLGLAYMRLSEIESRRGDRKAALASSRLGRDVLERLHAANPESVATAANLVELLTDVGRYEEDPAAARAALARAVAVGRAAVAAKPGDRRARFALAQALRFGGERTAVADGDPRAGAAMLDEGRGVLEALVREQPDDKDARDVLGHTLSSIGRARYAAGAFGEAAAARRAALAIFEDLARRSPGAYQRRLNLAVDRVNLATELLQLGQADAAAEVGRGAADDFAALARQYPDNARLGLHLIVALSNLAEIQRRRGLDDEADALFRRTLGQEEQRLARDPEHAFLGQLLGATLGDYGEFLRSNRGRPADALPVFDRSIAVLDRVLAKQPKDLNARTYLRNNLAGRADALDALGRPADALPSRDRAIALANSPAQAADLRRARALTVARGGDHAAAAAAADALAGPANGPPDAPIDTARILARAADAAREDARLGPEERTRQADAYLDRAADVIARAGRSGGLADRRRLRRLETLPDLAALRAHPVARAAIDAALDRGFPANPFATPGR